MALRKPLALAAAGAVALTLAACSSNDSKSTTAAASSAPAVASAEPTPAASIASLSGKMTQVTLDPGFIAGLTSLKLTPAPIGTATVDASGVASFPITGGNVKYYTPGTISPYVQGTINHAGSGLSLTGGGTVVQLTDFVIDPGASVLTGKVTANGQVAAASAPLFFLDGRTLKPLQAGPDGTAVLEGTTVSLTKDAADLLNKTFNTTALTQYFKVGVAKITVNTK